ncbi:MAG: serine hydrolase domain-containing protein [Gemmatimonadales bacterium]
MRILPALALMTLWVIPCASAQGVDGEWDASYETPGGTRSFKLVLVTKGDSVTGVVKRTAGDSPLRGIIRGDSIWFSYAIEYGGNALPIDIAGIVTGDTMSGTASFGGQAQEPFVARRVRPPGPGDRFARIDSVVRAEMERQRIPGLALAIVQKGKAVARGYGHANLEHLVPVTEETIFQSGSLGKMFTAALVMLLVEDGKLSLTDSITRFFPGAPATWRGITVRHLLTHTSGIPDYTTSSFDYRRDYSEEDLARFAFGTTLEFPAGTRWNYSNTGYALLGFIVGTVTGRFYGDLLQERIFKPLGMTTARVISEADIVPHRAAGYRLRAGQVKNQEWVAPKLNTTADGSLYFSLRDLVAWNRAVQQRALLRPEGWNEMLTPVRLASGKSYPYGMGWFLDERAGKPLQQHGGGWQGFRTQLSRFVGDSLDLIVLANLAQARPARFVDSIAAILNPRLAVKPPVPIADREPEVTERVARLLETVREGKLLPTEFAYVLAGFFPDAARAYERELVQLGAPDQLILLARRQLGDDRVYTYRASFARATRILEIAFAPDGRVASFSLSSPR